MNKKIIGVRFKPIGKIFYFDPMEQEFTTDDKVVVETIRGLELGDVVIANKEIDLDEFGIPLKPIIRKATERDIAQKLDNDKRKDEAREIFIQKNEEYGLGMNLLDVDFTLDLNKVIFFFTAEGRVDFRELVKDLARIFRMRIELRQVGVRDEAKCIPSVGKCGRKTCCSSFLGDFSPISISLAKNQDLTLNGSKLSGLCGRLMCCLNYEADQYNELVGKMPKIGAIVITEQGKGVVIDRYILKQSLKVELKEGDNVGKVILTFADEVKDTGKIDKNYIQESYTDDDNEDIKNIEGD